ncbi:hypothetical protein DPMN_164191 [Dreissena polymorpha]|uniref:Uncharacterized protein n=1 Tax=Dreissena polymorpha TaxID=45954 RepID=A0A9D4EY27_DREPO|nr:hypothetical protein DPMN_164191 [Dreissena polymorpha]
MMTSRCDTASSGLMNSSCCTISLLKSCKIRLPVCWTGEVTLSDCLNDDFTRLHLPSFGLMTSSCCTDSPMECRSHAVRRLVCWTCDFTLPHANHES